MHDVDIYTLLMAIRGFSNEITVRGLADKLGISYSTLARCKNGVWPRSMKLGAMRDVLEECRERFFEGDGEAMARAMMLQFKDSDVNVSPLETALADGGYEQFVDTLLLTAHTPQAKTQAAPEDSAKPQVDEADQGQQQPAESDANPQDIEKPEPPAPTELYQDKQSRHARIHDVLILLPFAAVLLAGVCNLSFSAMLPWIRDHQAVCAVALLVIAFSPVMTGTFIDSRIAWRTFARAHPNVRRTREAYRAVAKYGDIGRVEPRAGRFNLTTPYVFYQASCNVTGALCVISLYAFLFTLPGFEGYLVRNEWTEFFKVGIVVAYFIAYAHAREQIKRPRPAVPGDAMDENPDNYLPSRVHVWANSLHLVCVISMIIGLLLTMIAYSISCFRQNEAPVLVLWPYLQTMLFLVQSSASPAARRIHATSVGIMAPGVLASAIGTAALVTTCFLPSWRTVVICAACAISAIVVLVWKAREQQVAPDWLAEGRQSRFYGIAIPAAVAMLLFLGAVSTTLLF